MQLPSLNAPELAHLNTFAISLALGFLIGLERERRPNPKAGVRTFSITALLGTLAALLADKAASPWILVAAFAGVAAFITSAYWRRDEAEPGTTTQVALLVCFGLGAMVWYGEATLAIMLAIVTTMLLYFKTEIEDVSRSLTRRDLVSVLQFAVVTFIVLPVLPNRGFGPYDALNPYQIWLMVVLVSGISLAGYVALRLLGQRHGAPLLGLMGGLVSSTATTLVYARHSRTHADLTRFAALVILLANLMVMVRLLVVTAVLAPALLPPLAAVLGTGLALGILVMLAQWRHLTASGEAVIPEIKNPTELRTALTFAALYALVLLLAAWLADSAGAAGLYAVAAVSGLTDVDALTLSTLRLLDLARIAATEAIAAITIAFLANLAFKFGLIAAVGGRALALTCLPAMTALALGCALALAWV